MYIICSFTAERVKLNESIEKLSEGIQWAKTALLEWRQVMMSGDEANKMIEKLCRMDAGKAEVRKINIRLMIHSNIY